MSCGGKDVVTGICSSGQSDVTASGAFGLDQPEPPQAAIGAVFACESSALACRDASPESAAWVAVGACVGHLRQPCVSMSK